MKNPKDIFIFIYFISFFPLITGCGMHVIALVDDEKVREKDIAVRDSTIQTKLIYNHRKELNEGKIKLDDENLINEKKEIEQKERYRALADKIHEIVMEKLEKQYDLTAPQKNKNLATSKASNDDFEEIQKRNNAKQRAQLKTFLEVKDDGSNSREVYQKYYSGKDGMTYSAWLMLLSINKNKKEVRESIKSMESEKEWNRGVGEFGEMFFSAFSEMNELIKTIDRENEKSDPVYGECKKQVLKNQKKLKECTLDARKRWWDKKYKELGVKVTDDKYLEAEKYISETYILEGVDSATLEGIKKTIKK